MQIPNATQTHTWCHADTYRVPHRHSATQTVLYRHILSVIQTQCHTDTYVPSVIQTHTQCYTDTYPVSYRHAHTQGHTDTYPVSYRHIPSVIQTQCHTGTVSYRRSVIPGVHRPWVEGACNCVYYLCKQWNPDMANSFIFSSFHIRYVCDVPAVETNKHALSSRCYKYYYCMHWLWSTVTPCSPHLRFHHMSPSVLRSKGVIIFSITTTKDRLIHWPFCGS